MRANKIKNKGRETETRNLSVHQEDIHLEEKEDNFTTRFGNMWNVKVRDFKLKEEWKESSDDYESSFRVVIRNSGNKLRWSDDSKSSDSLEEIGKICDENNSVSKRILPNKPKPQSMQYDAKNGISQNIGKLD